MIRAAGLGSLIETTGLAPGCDIHTGLLYGVEAPAGLEFRDRG